MAGTWYARMNRVLEQDKPATLLGEWPQGPALFIRVTWETLPVLYGVAGLAVDSRIWQGSAIDQARALDAIEQQTTEPPLTADEVARQYGAQYRVLDGQTLEVQEGPGLGAPPWEFRLVPGPDGGAVLEARSMEGV